jgi:4-amino-4-deoxychorismate lyase
MPKETLALAVLGQGLVDPGLPWLRVDDGAVLRGRAVFETLRVYAGRPFRLPAHLDRLSRSAHVLGLDPPDPDALTGLVYESLAQLGAADAVLRVVWTAGAETSRPVGFALVTALPEGLERTRAAGIELRSLQLAIGAAARHASPWLLPGVKSTSYAVNIAAQTEARRRGADDALFLSLEGIVLECPTSNVWFVSTGVLHTPALDLGILAGVTRDTLVDAAAAAGIAVEAGAYELDRLAGAAEVFTSSSIREVMPVVRLDGAAVGDGRPGPIAAVMQAGLRAATAMA